MTRELPGLKYLRIGALFALAMLAYYLRFGEFGLTSDSCNAYLQSIDLVSGNPKLTHWVFASNQFLSSDVAFLALMHKLVGFKPQLVYLDAAFFWTCVVFVAFWLCGPGRRWGVAALLAFPLLGANDSMFMLGLAPMHTGTLTYVLIAMGALDRFSSGGDRRWLALSVVTLALGIFGDPMALFVGAVPCSLACFGRAAWRPSDRRCWLGLGAVVAAVVISRLILMAWQHDGFRVVKLVLLFVEPQELGRTLAVAIRGATGLVGADFWGNSISGPNLPKLALYLMRLPLLPFMLAAVLALMGREIRALNDPEAAAPELLDCLLMCAFCVDVAAVLLNSTVKTPDHIRYLLPALVFGSILLSRQMAGNRIFGRYILPVVVVSGLYDLSLSLPHLTQGRFLAKREVEHVLTRLGQLHLSEGYSEYWDSGLMRVVSQNAVHPRPLEKPHELLEPYVWFVKTENFRVAQFTQPRFFVLTRQTKDPGNWEQADVERTFGRPEQQEQVDYYLINIYSRPNPAQQRIESRMEEICRAMP